MRLAHVALSSSGDSLDTGAFTAKDYLWVQIKRYLTGSVNSRIRVNGDSGSNYAHRYSGGANSYSESTSINQTSIYSHAATSNESFTNYFITNKADKEKLMIIEEVNGGAAGSGNAPARAEVVAKWTNTSDQITSIQCINTDSGDLTSGTYITVFGATDDVVTDEKTTLADATSDTTQVASTSDITDLSWTELGSSGDTFYVVKNASNERIDIKAAGNCGTESSPSVAYATLSDTLGTTYWRMRFKLVWDSSGVTPESTGGKSFFTTVGIKDNATSQGTAGTGNGFAFSFGADAGSTQSQFRSQTAGVVSGTATQNPWSPTNDTIYCEITWDGGTATGKIFTSSDYSTTQKGSTITKTGTFSGLKYIQIGLRQDNGGNGVQEFTMSNLEIINRVSTAPNINTRYEETDTRKIFRAKQVGFAGGSSGSGSDWTEVSFDSSTAVNNATASGNVVSRSSGSNWTSYIRSSTHYLDPSEGGGEVYFTVSDNSHGSVGLEKAPYNSTPSDVYTSRDYSFHTTTATNNIYESTSSYDGTDWNSSNDEFRITMDSAGLVKYYWRTDSSSSWNLERTSTVTASGKYYVSVSPHSTATCTSYIKSSSTIAWKERGTA